MATPKIWSGNPSQEISDGNVQFDDSSTEFDSLLVFFDGTAPVNLINEYVPTGTIWTPSNT